VCANPTLCLLHSIVCCKLLSERFEACPIQPVTTYRAILDPQQEWEGGVVFTVHMSTDAPANEEHSCNHLCTPTYTGSQSKGYGVPFNYNSKLLGAN
jgi:hypothetical protein